MLGTYGDGGNAEVLIRRSTWRGFPAEHLVVEPDGAVPDGGDIYLLGGGEDATQLRALALLGRGAMHRALAGGAACLAVCAGLQLLGERLPSSGGSVGGLGILDLTTAVGEPRLVGEVVVAPRALPILPLTGFENHGGRTTLGPGTAPLGRVLVGGGNGVDGVDGAVSGPIIGTYLHGPVLARNPALADWLLGQVLGEPLRPLRMEGIEVLRTERLQAARHPMLQRPLLHRLVRRVAAARSTLLQAAPNRHDERP